MVHTLNGDTVVEVKASGTLDGAIGKIHNKVITNQYITDANRQIIKEKLLGVINKWFVEINKAQDKKDKVDYLRAIIKDIYNDISVIEIYLDKLIETAKYLAVIEGVDKTTPNSKK